MPWVHIAGWHKADPDPLLGVLDDELVRTIDSDEEIVKRTHALVEDRARWRERGCSVEELAVEDLKRFPEPVARRRRKAG